MLEERFDKNFTLMFNTKKSVIPAGTIDGRKILIKAVDLQWKADDDRYQGCRNYIKIRFVFADDLDKMSSDDSGFDEDENQRQMTVTIREGIFDTETGEFTYPNNEI